MGAKLLYTLGYEGSLLGDFLAELSKRGIRRIIDVRELPLSRKRGFSKTALANALADIEVDYTHLRALGDPKAGRQAARSGDFTSFRRIYAQHLKTAGAQEALDLAGKLALENFSALLCYERNYVQCHRDMVAASLCEQFSLKVCHIEVAIPSRKKSAPIDVYRHAGVIAFG